MASKEMISSLRSYFSSKPIDKAWLFGSFSRNEERADSDVDILVSFQKDARISLLTFAGMVCDLEQLLQRNVDLVEDGMLLPFAAKTAEHDKILIYDRAN